MLILRRLPRVFVTLNLLPALRQPLLVDAPRQATCTSQPARAGHQPRSFHSSVAAMSATSSSSSAAEATAAAESECPTPTATETATAATTKSGDSSAASEAPECKLPPLTPAEFRVYNHMADGMNMYHNHFRSTWNLLWSACEKNKRPSHLSLKAFIQEGLQFVSQLTLHHNIEETYIFPVLAKKMPEFKAGKGNGAAELLRQHREIHRGMDVLDEYLKGCRSGEYELELSVLKGKLETWGTVLWTHLDQEVKTLGAENMRKYWTPEEMRRMPM